MFERNKVDNSLQQTTVPAELTLVDDRVVKGQFVIAASRSIYEVLNGDSYFLEFESYEGDRQLIARAALKAVKILSLSSVNGLKNRVRNGETFDPYGVLGVGRDASREDIRSAYHSLSKIYHPDLFASQTLPAEVRDYLAAMARRINAAYNALELPLQQAKIASAEKSRPIYTSPQRG
ncbi:MAG: J domain-containing protein [Hyphomicrobium sp.]